MKREVQDILYNLINRYPTLGVCSQEILEAFNVIKESYYNGGKLLICGNGGSAADAEHIVGELMKGFCKKRKINSRLSDKFQDIDPVIGQSLAENLQETLPAIALVENIALSTAYQNDCVPEFAFAQQVLGYGLPGDVLLGISTSGNSENVVAATIVAKAKGLKVVGLTGCNGGRLKHYSDVSICVPNTETYIIQELHLPIYHCLCAMLEEYFYG